METGDILQSDMPHRLCVPCRKEPTIGLAASTKYTTVGDAVNEISGVGSLVG